MGPSGQIREDVAPTWLLEPLSIEDTAERYLRPALRETFVDLCRKGPGDAATNARLLFMYFCLDLIQRKSDPSAKKIQWRTHREASGS